MRPNCVFVALVFFAVYRHRSALRGIPGSACPQPEPNATELPSTAPGRPKLIELQPTTLSPTPAHGTSRRAEDRAPPRPRPPARAEGNFARYRAADLACRRDLRPAASIEMIP